MGDFLGIVLKVFSKGRGRDLLDVLLGVELDGRRRRTEIFIVVVVIDGHRRGRWWRRRWRRIKNKSGRGGRRDRRRRWHRRRWRDRRGRHFLREKKKFKKRNRKIFFFWLFLRLFQIKKSVQLYFLLLSPLHLVQGLEVLVVLVPSRPPDPRE